MRRRVPSKAMMKKRRLTLQICDQAERGELSDQADMTKCGASSLNLPICQEETCYARLRALESQTDESVLIVAAVASNLDESKGYLRCTYFPVVIFSSSPLGIARGAIHASPLSPTC